MGDRRHKALEYPAGPSNALQAILWLPFWQSTQFDTKKGEILAKHRRLRQLAAMFGDFVECCEDYDSPETCFQFIKKRFISQRERIRKLNNEIVELELHLEKMEGIAEF